MSGDEHSADRHRDDASPPEAADDPVLKAKYLDYCSARLSEVFLSLSDERIYRLVEEAAREGRLDIATLSFDEMVKLVTEKLRQSVPLPDFETWAREYREDPEQYDRYLLGLWERSPEANPSVTTGETPDPEEGG